MTAEVWAAGMEAVLLDALDGVSLSEADRRMVLWLATWPATSVEQIAELLRKCRQAGPAAGNAR